LEFQQQSFVERRGKFAFPSHVSELWYIDTVVSTVWPLQRPVALFVPPQDIDLASLLRHDPKIE